MNIRSVILLVLAVLLPAASLGVLGSVLIGQQREVLRLREQDRRLLVARVAGDTLDARLDRSARRVEAAVAAGDHSRYPGNAGLLFLGTIAGDTWTPPYERDVSSAVSTSSFQERLWTLRRSEASGGDAASLANEYRTAEQAVRDSAQVAFLKLQRGRILRTVDPARADEVLGSVARLDDRITDEFGIPLALYAIELLGPRAPSFRTDRWLNPAAQEYLEDLDSTVTGTEYAVFRHAAAVGPALSGWQAVPEIDWVVGRHGDVVLGAPVDKLAELLGDVNGVSGVHRYEGADDLPLAPDYPGLVVHVTSAAEIGTPAALWAIGLALILILSAGGGLLLLRDWRREKRLAQVRAEFVSSVSHEVRTPLTAIRLYTESLLAYGPGDDADWRRDLSTIADETGRLTRMLDNVLRASRMDRGTTEYHLADGRLDLVVTRAVQAMAPTVADAGVTLSMDAEPVEARFDPDAMEQAVVNLLSNAAKFAPGTSVAVRCARADDGVLVSVEDHGPGVPTEDARKIFQPFYRAAKTRETGSGLGLSIVQHVAVGHGGRAFFEPVPGGGSRFTIQIPTRS